MSDLLFTTPVVGAAGPGFAQNISEDIDALRTGLGGKIFAVGSTVTDITTEFQVWCDSLEDGTTNYVVGDLAGAGQIGRVDFDGTRTGVTVVGIGVLITVTGTGAVSNYRGIALGGTLRNCEFRGFRIEGDGNAAHYHAGIWTAFEANLTNVRLLDNEVVGVTVALQIGSNIGSIDVGCRIEGNYIDETVGSTSGSGYAISRSAGATGTHLLVIANIIVGSQRHSIYISVGSKSLVANNIIKDHRLGIATGDLLPAIVIARTQDDDIIGNIIDNSYDGAISVEPDVSANQNILSINVVGNMIVQPHTHGIWIGSDDPGNVLAPPLPCQGVNVAGNIFSLVGGTSTNLIRYRSGTRVRISGNFFSAVDLTTQCAGIEVACQGETAGTANYSGYAWIKDNHGWNTNAGGGSFYLIEIAATAALSSAHLFFSGNEYQGPNHMFLCGATVTNPNVKISMQEFDGYVTSVALATQSQPSPLSIGGGQAISKHLSVVTTWNPDSMVDGAVTSKVVTLTGAALGDTAVASFDLIAANLVLISANVSAADTVTVILLNKSGITRDFSTGNLRVDVWKH